MHSISRICVVLLGSAAFLSACAGTQSEKVTALQRKDKNLSCKEVLLEINESEFYRKTAQQNKNPQLSTLLMPLGYVSTYMSAEEAGNAANARIDYLNRIYDILGCEKIKDAPQAVAYPPYSDYPVGRMSYQPPPPSPATAPIPYQYEY